jgi:hypothetical protein
MTDVSFADVEYQIKHLPADKLPIVYRFILSLTESSEHPDSKGEYPEMDYDFTKTDLWKIRGTAHIEGDAGKAEQNHIQKKTNYANTVDEVVYGVSLSEVQKE